MKSVSDQEESSASLPQQSNVSKKKKMGNIKNKRRNRTNNDCSIEIKRNTSIYKKILFEKYYEVISKIEGKGEDKRQFLHARCKSCNIAVIKGAFNITSNFIRHLKNMHLDKYNSYIEDKKTFSLNSKINLKPAKRVVKTSSDELDVIGTKRKIITRNFSFNNTTAASSLICELELSDTKKRRITRNLSSSDRTVTPSSSSSINELDENDTKRQIRIIRNLSSSDPKAASSSSINELAISDINRRITRNLSSSSSTAATLSTNELALSDNNRRRITRNLSSSSSTAATSSTNELSLSEIKKQMIITTSNVSKEIILENNFDIKILKFLISTKLSVNIIENDDFKNLFEGTSMQVMDKSIAIEKLKLFHKLIDNKIKMEIMKFNYHCLTVDIWSYRNVKILIITCNWLDELFKRQTTLLCCKRFSNGSDVIDNIIKEIYEKLKTNNKILAAIFSDEINYIKEFQKSNIIENIIDSSLDDDHKNILNEIKHVDLPMEFFNCDNKINLNMPSMLKSVTHTINLITTIDFANYLKENPNLLLKNKQMFSKCSKLWMADANIQTLDTSINYPNAIKWNSLYHALNDILQIKDYLTELCETLEIDKFTKDDLFYMNELCMVLKPFSDAIDFLEKYENSYYGYLIPTLVTIMTKLKKLETINKIKYFIDLIQHLKLCLTQRFNDIFTLKPNVNNAIIASICFPSIKLRWLNAMQETASHFDVKVIHDLIINLIKKDMDTVKCNVQLPETKQNLNPFFDFDDKSDCIANITNDVELEYYNYLNDCRTDMSVLKDYPSIERLFIKYNTILPSSGLNENLFSYLDLMNTAQRYDLTDEEYEILTFLKANYDYTDESVLSKLI